MGSGGGRERQERQDRLGPAWGEEGDRFGEVLSKSQPDLQIADRLLKICLRVGSNQHDEGEGESGVRGMRIGK
jgi:hypothetical protein